MIDPCNECTKDNRYCRHCGYNPSVREQGQIAWMPEDGEEFLSGVIIDDIKIYDRLLTRKK